MADDILSQAQAWLRAFVVDGVPASGSNEPVKADGIAVFQTLVSSLGTFGLASAVTVAWDTLAHLNADLSHPASTLAVVYNDGTASNNGFYSRGSGGAWVSTGIALPTTFAADLTALSSTVTGHTTSIAANTAAIATAAALAKTNAVSTAQLQLYGKAADAYQPLVVDPLGAVVIAISPSTGAVKARFDQGQILAQTAKPSSRIKLYAGSDDVLPVAQDEAGNTILGLRRSTGGLVAAVFEGIPPASQSTSIIPIATGDKPTLTGWMGYIAYGQSNATAWGAQPSLSLTQPYDNLTFTGGTQVTKTGNGFGGAATAAMTSSEALVETDYGTGNPAGDGNTTSGETTCTGAASYIVSRALVEGHITDPSQLVIFASVPGHGGYVMSRLAKGFSPGVPNNWYQNLIDHVTQAHALAVGAGKTYSLPCVTLIESAGDNEFSTSRATYLAELQQFLIDINTDIPAITGQAFPVHILAVQECSFSASNNGPVLATMDAVNASPRIHFVVAEYAFGPKSPSNILHFANTGHFLLARYYGRAWKQLVLEGRAPDCIWPISATAQGSVLKIKFRVPHLPLAIDLATMAATFQAGFTVSDGTGSVDLSNIAVTALGDTVQMTLSRALGTSPVVNYALDNLGAGLWFDQGASGNLRDTTPETFTYAGKVYPMWHFCPHFQLPVAILDPMTSEP